MKLSFFPYQLPFKTPLEASHKTYRHRSGLVLTLSNANRVWYGEAAPLPGFSSETTADIVSLAKKHGALWKKMLSESNPVQLFSDYYSNANIPPSLQFGLDSLAYQREAHRAQKPLISYLFNSVSHRIAVNGLASLAREESIFKNIERLTGRGFKTIKCKVGISPEPELQILTTIRERYPELRIRLDANRAWTLEEACSHLSALETLDVEYCEEPLAEPSPENYRKLQQRTKVPLALDESLTAADKSNQALLPCCSVSILKPMVIGSFQKLFNLGEQARQFGSRIVITTSLETGIGRTITAMLASGLGSPNLAHGLNTAGLLKQDFLPGKPAIEKGFIAADKLFPIAVENQRLNRFSKEPIILS